MSQGLVRSAQAALSPTQRGSPRSMRSREAELRDEGDRLLPGVGSEACLWHERRLRVSCPLVCRSGPGEYEGGPGAGLSAWQVGNLSLAAPPDAGALHRSGLVGGAGVTCDARPTRVNWPCVFMSLNRRSSSNQQIGQITSSCNRKDSNDGKERSDDDATYGGARSASSTTDGQAGDCSTDGAWSNGRRGAEALLRSDASHDCVSTPQAC